MTKPKCPFAKNCKAKIDKEHFEKYCCVSMREACLFGFEGCPHYAKLRRKSAVEWQTTAQRRDKSIKEVRRKLSSEIPECPNCKKPLDAVRKVGGYAQVFKWADGKYEVTMLLDYADTYECAKCGHKLGGELREFFLRHQVRRGE